MIDRREQIVTVRLVIDEAFVIVPWEVDGVRRPNGIRMPLARLLDRARRRPG